MSSLNRHDAGQLLDYALRLRLAGHGIKNAKVSKPFIRRAKVLKNAHFSFSAQIRDSG